MNILLRSLAAIGCMAGLVLAQQPAIPLHTQSRWIMDRDGQRVKFRCINWAGHLETNIPEGLHKQSIDYIADWIRNEGFNCVRLTYSIDMALNPGLKIRDSFVIAAGSAGVSVDGMNGLFSQVVARNPYLADANIRDVFGIVVDKLWDRGVMTVLDNHVSKAAWCCNLSDGNGWWGDAPGYDDGNSRFFDSAKWLAGLQTQAIWARDHRGIVAMSLRNELRAAGAQFATAPDQWKWHMSAAAKTVHEANPDVLIVLGGTNGGADFSFMRDSALDTSAWAGKNVWEAHDYSFTVTTPDLGFCFLNKQTYGFFWGFLLEQNKAQTGPLFLSEFGVGMQGGPRDGLTNEDYNYLRCLIDYIQGNDADWALWAIQGGYYVRDRIIDAEETWGAMDRDWNGWRNPKFKGMLGNIFKVQQRP